MPKAIRPSAKTLFLGAKRITLNAGDLIGEGGEAEVYKYDSEHVIKVFKQSSHPEFACLPAMQRLLIAKQFERQSKLPSFPLGLPPEIIAPQEMVFDKPAGGEIMAYTMDYLDLAPALFYFARADFKYRYNVGDAEVCEIFRSMHRTLSTLHKAGIVVGDLNPHNILVKGTTAFFIDADSMQYGGFLCSTFCNRYVDPLHCDSSLKMPVMNKAHNTDTDWYAFSVLLFESLLQVHPYGGIYRPRNPADRVAQDERPLRRISVLHPEVQYPVAGIPFKSLRKDLLTYFEDLFLRDRRGIMPEDLLTGATHIATAGWGVGAAGIGSGSAGHGAGTTGLGAASTSTAGAGAPFAIPQVRDLNLTPVFKEQGSKILEAAYQDGRLRILYWNSGRYLRENAKTVMNGNLSTDLRFKLCGERTVVGRRNMMVLLSPSTQPEKFSAELFRGGAPVVETNSNAVYWMDGGKIWREGPRIVHEALSNQTRIWIGETLGFGFYQAGQFRRAFIFDLQNESKFNLSDGVIPANAIEAECHFAQNLVWVLTQRKEGTQIINRCTVVDRNGTVMASEEQSINDDSWLGRISGKCAASNYLISAIDGGLVQIGIERGRLVEVIRFEQTNVSKDDKLIHSPKGLYVWNSNEIYLLSTQANAAGKGACANTTAHGTPSAGSGAGSNS